MKKVRFDNAGAIALQLKLGRDMPPDRRVPVAIEGWLVGDHLCVRKPAAAGRGFSIVLFPWGDRLSGDFFAKADAVACAKEIAALGLPWEHVRELDIKSAEYRGYVQKSRDVLAVYALDGLMIYPDD